MKEAKEGELRRESESQITTQSGFINRLRSVSDSGSESLSKVAREEGATTIRPLADVQSDRQKKTDVFSRLISAIIKRFESKQDTLEEAKSVVSKKFKEKKDEDKDKDEKYEHNKNEYSAVDDSRDGDEDSNKDDSFAEEADDEMKEKYISMMNDMEVAPIPFIQMLIKHKEFDENLVKAPSNSLLSYIKNMLLEHSVDNEYEDVHPYLKMKFRNYRNRGDADSDAKTDQSRIHMKENHPFGFTNDQNRLASSRIHPFGFTDDQRRTYLSRIHPFGFTNDQKRGSLTKPMIHPFGFADNKNEVHSRIVHPFGFGTKDQKNHPFSFGLSEADHPYQKMKLHRKDDSIDHPYRKLKIYRKEKEYPLLKMKFHKKDNSIEYPLLKMKFHKKDNSIDYPLLKMKFHKKDTNQVDNPFFKAKFRGSKKDSEHPFFKLAKFRTKRNTKHPFFKAKLSKRQSHGRYSSYIDLMCKGDISRAPRYRGPRCKIHQPSDTEVHQQVRISAKAFGLPGDFGDVLVPARFFSSLKSDQENSGSNENQEDEGSSKYKEIGGIEKDKEFSEDEFDVDFSDFLLPPTFFAEKDEKEVNEVVVDASDGEKPFRRNAIFNPSWLQKGRKYMKTRRSPVHVRFGGKRLSKSQAAKSIYRLFSTLASRPSSKYFGGKATDDAANRPFINTRWG